MTFCLNEKVESLGQWFSTFLMMQHLNTVPYVVATPKHKIIFNSNS